MNCGNCKYAKPLNDEAIACHRYPPTITKVEDLRVTSHFPLLANAEWCGEWRLGTSVSIIDKSVSSTKRTKWLTKTKLPK